MAINKWMKRLQTLDGAVKGDYNPFAHVIRTPSPSTNYCFGNTHGLPAGMSMVLFGPPKGGKSLLIKAMIGQMHLDDPEALAVNFNTEMREMAQMTEAQARVWNIDRDRYTAYDVNSPSLIFDRIEKDISAACDEGAPIRLIAIDSLNSIQGRRAENADTIDTQQIGDLALTLGDGLKRILPTIRKHRISLVMTAHIRAEMDQLEIKRGNKVRMGIPLAVQHFAEYFIYVEPNRNVEGRKSLMGKEFENKGVTDLAGNSEKTGHKIRVKMKDSSVGPKGRVGEFTLDYNRGLINIGEETFILGTRQKIIEQVNNTSYRFGTKEWKGGKKSVIDALDADVGLRNQVIQTLRERDIAGQYREEDEAAAAEVATDGDEELSYASKQS